VPHIIGIAGVAEAGGETVDQPIALSVSASGKNAPVLCQAPAVEINYDPTPADPSQIELRRATLRLHRGPFRVGVTYCHK